MTMLSIPTFVNHVGGGETQTFWFCGFCKMHNGPSGKACRNCKLLRGMKADRVKPRRPDMNCWGCRMGREFDEVDGIRGIGGIIASLQRLSHLA